MIKAYTSTSIYWRSILPYFVNHIENEIFLHLTNLYLHVVFGRRLSRPKEHWRTSCITNKTARDDSICWTRRGSGPYSCLWNTIMDVARVLFFPQRVSSLTSAFSAASWRNRPGAIFVSTIVSYLSTLASTSIMILMSVVCSSSKLQQCPILLRSVKRRCDGVRWYTQC